MSPENVGLSTTNLVLRHTTGGVMRSVILRLPGKLKALAPDEVSRRMFGDWPSTEQSSHSEQQLTTHVWWLTIGQTIKVTSDGACLVTDHLQTWSKSQWQHMQSVADHLPQINQVSDFMYVWWLTIYKQSSHSDNVCLMTYHLLRQSNHNDNSVYVRWLTIYEVTLSHSANAKEILRTRQRVNRCVTG